ncbi:hypothetical protein NTR1_66 [Nocardia phage NTR1]|nr:hypothetical protein NTR1_66 [Nocardia phage NTR1]
MTKRDALTKVRLAAMDLAMSQPGQPGHTTEKYRKANATLARAQMAAVDAGASPAEINQSSEWNGATL